MYVKDLSKVKTFGKLFSIKNKTCYLIAWHDELNFVENLFLNTGLTTIKEMPLSENAA